MRRFMKRCLAVAILASFLPVSFASAEALRRFRAYNDLGVDFPVDGGVMLMGSRSWRIARHLDAGFVLGGGEIDRDFDLKNAAGQTFSSETKSFVFPFVGPQVTFNFNWIGLSVGYAAFYAKTDLTVHGGSL
jgi:hypothetical protein